MDWDAPAIVLDARPFNEGDAIATVMTEEHGLHRGLARGGTSRAQVGLWQAGNLVQVRWVARLSDQLGSFSAEMIHAGAAFVMDDPLALAMLSSLCAVAEGALPEREPHPRVFHGLVHLVARLPRGAVMLNDLILWETALLAELGYGLDLTSCALTGETTGLAFVSPRTGRAVTEAAAGIWKSRLLRLPDFLAGGITDDTADASAPDASAPDAGAPDACAAGWRDGLALTGHFLARDVFGAQHRPLPRARQMLYDRVAALAGESSTTEPTTTGGSNAG
ncbi:MAG TPA: DNA repair protein RecO [Acetobacteraceae bacterium]|nr:DNA repair protein RecO [Acetobacteraceae bacterium]